VQRLGYLCLCTFLKFFLTNRFRCVMLILAAPERSALDAAVQFLARQMNCRETAVPFPDFG